MFEGKWKVSVQEWNVYSGKKNFLHKIHFLEIFLNCSKVGFVMDKMIVEIILMKSTVMDPRSRNVQMTT